LLPVPSLRFLTIAALTACLVATPAAAATLDQMAGQMIVVGFQGDDMGDASVEALAGAIGRGEIGGVMYLKTNVKSLDDVLTMNMTFRGASPDLPPFVTLDQEGGAVERLTEDVGFTEIPSAAEVAKGSPGDAEALYADMARRIAELGFTVNFGPVVDLDLNPDNLIIAKFGRAFGATPDEVEPYAEAFVRAHHAAGLLTALKHFPGHGSSTADSHEGFVHITDTWQPDELQPYQALIGDGLADMVMVGHLINTGVDAEGLPSSLSPAWIEDVLRTELGFEGVVITDDLEMGAIREHFDLEETVVRAVSAGVDVLLFSNTAKYRASLADEVRAILVAKAEADPAFAARIEESYGRIVALKERIGE
jgi:beta-N-acetylhexosaminidase